VKERCRKLWAIAYWHTCTYCRQT